MKVLLVIPKDDHLIHRESVIPLGIAYINGALRADGIDVISFNLNYIDTDLEAFLEEVIRIHGVDVFLCGGTSYNYRAMKALFTLVKKLKPSIITVGGGVAYTSNPLLFAEMTNPDYAILGEGEVTVCQLIRCLEAGNDVTAVDGIMYRLPSGTYQFTKERKLIYDVDSIPFPSYEGLCVDRLFEDLNNYDDSAHFDYDSVDNPRVLPMLFGRSCPYGCKFCFHTIGRRYRARSLDHFFAELDLLIAQYDISGITIMDEFFGVNQKVIFEFCDRIAKYHLKWFAEVRVDIITPELVDRMKVAGCTNVLIGLESMDDGILEDMNKRITAKQSEAALEILYQRGMTISGNFIAVTPQETMETFYKTFDWWNRHRHYQIDFVHLQLCPGTDYYKDAAQKGIITDERLFIERGLPELNDSRLSMYEWDKVRRIIGFTRMDNVMNGQIRVDSLEQDRVNCTLTCRHCAHQFKVSLDRKKGYDWKKHIFKCPSCNHKSMYRIYDDSHTQFEQELFKQQMMNTASGVQMRSWLKEKHYRKVVLYGCGYNLIFMKTEIEHNGGEVAAVVYTNEDALRLYSSTVYGKTISLEELPSMCGEDDTIDALIVCQTNEYLTTCQMLRKTGYCGKIDSMVNAILQHDYYIDEHIWQEV